MAKTKGYAAQVANGKIEPWEFERREVGATDISIDIEFAGICHSDIHQVKEEWGEAIFPMVPGHEIVGTVVAVGSDVKKFKVGDIAGVGCFVDSCGTCEYCIDGNDHWCLDNSAYTYTAWNMMALLLHMAATQRTLLLKPTTPCTFQQILIALVRRHFCVLASQLSHLFVTGMLGLAKK